VAIKKSDLYSSLWKLCDDNFVNLMDQHLPNWRSVADSLNAAPLAHEEWKR